MESGVFSVDLNNTKSFSLLCYWCVFQAENLAVWKNARQIIKSETFEPVDRFVIYVDSH